MTKKEEKILALINEAQDTEQGFRLLINTYGQKLYWQIRRMVFNHQDADDILQNVWLKVWKKLHQFKGNASLRTWLYRIAYNESIDFLRKKQKMHTVDEEGALEYFTSQLKADPYFDGDEAALKLQAAIAALPEKQRMVFILKYFDEMPYKEMSEALETSEGALKASYHHAVKKIEEYVKNY